MVERVLDVTIHRGQLPGPPPARVAVSSCIGCGAISSGHECTGDCRDRKLELVGADAHDRVLAATAVARERFERLMPAVSRLAGEPAPSDPRGALLAVQALARELMPAARAEPALDPDPAVVTAWWCTTCDRVEAPQPCLGVCIHRPETMVALAVHRAALAAAEAAMERERLAAGVVRLAALVRPREDGWERTWRALSRQARMLRAGADPL
jgi:hypothetical protein